MVYSIYVIYIRCGWGLGLVSIYIYIYIYRFLCRFVVIIICSSQTQIFSFQCMRRQENVDNESQESLQGKTPKQIYPYRKLNKKHQLRQKEEIDYKLDKLNSDSGIKP